MWNNMKRIWIIFRYFRNIFGISKNIELYRKYLILERQFNEIAYWKDNINLGDWINIILIDRIAKSNPSYYENNIRSIDGIKTIEKVIIDILQSLQIIQQSQS